MMSLDDCSGPNLKCWIKNCRFQSITQKGLTIHLQTLHGIEYRERTRPLKGARSRRKNAAPRDFHGDPSWSRPFVCLICQIGYATKEELTRHSKQAHGCGSSCSPRAGVIPGGSPNNPGGSGRSRGRAQTRPEPPYSFQRCQPDPQCTRAVRPTFDQYYVNQVQLRPEEYHEQASQMAQESVAQGGQYERALYDAQRTATDWTGYRSSVQTPQTMTAEYASTIQSRSNDNSNAWIPQVSAQRVDDGNIQLWSSVGQMQSFQYDMKKEPEGASQDISGTIQPCTQCGCASRGGCTQRTVDGLGNVNRIILVEEDSGAAPNGTENHEVYHLQACSSLENFKASNVKQVVNQGDVIVLECHTEDGREVVLKALRAGPEAEGPVETRNEATDGMTLSLAAPIDAPDMENDSAVLESPSLNQDHPPTPEETPHSATVAIEQPAEEPMHLTLPQLFPELFEDCMEGSEATKSVSWQSDETEEADNFFEVCNKSEYLAALSNCRGVRDDSGSLLLKCCRCEYCTDVGDPLEQLQIHIRKHMEKRFQCQKCEFKSLLREEMLVHAGTQHDVVKTENPY